MANFFKIILALVVMISSFATRAFSQNEYFISDNNDTIKCSFTFMSGNTTLRYKLRGRSETLKISRNDVKEYKMDGVTYVKKNIVGYARPTFVQRIMRGKINVYVEIYNAGYVNVINYFASKDDDASLISFHSNGLMGSQKQRNSFFDFLIADTPEIVEIFNAADSYNIKTLLRTIRNYDLYNLSGAFFVNNKNDTTHCKIIFNKDGELLYRTPFARNFEPLKTDSLKAYKLNGILYYKQQIPDKNEAQFIVHLIKGSINLYADLDDNVYVSKAGSPLTKIKGEEKIDDRKDVLLELISDKPELMKDFEKKRYNEDNLLQVIRDYNDAVPKI